MEKFVAFILTKYQYHVLLTALHKLNIDKKDVFLIIAEKAKKQGVNGEGFYKAVYYKENYSLKNWGFVKQQIDFILKQINFYPKAIFLRNYEYPLARKLMSRFTQSQIYLIEDGMASYLNLKFLGYSKIGGIREYIKTFLTRLYFSKGKLRIFPFYENKVIKVGISDKMKPWLKAPFIEIDMKEIYFSNKSICEECNGIDVLILDQPLWQLGLSKTEVLDIYKKLFVYVNDNFKELKVAIKLHPSTKIEEIKELLKNLEINNVEVLNISKNIEELLYSDNLSNIEVFIGFYSWALVLIKTYLKNKCVIAIADEKLIDLTKGSYEILKKFDIEIVKGE